MEAGIFFFLTAPGHGPGAVPPPLSRGRTGLRPERSVAEWREQTHPICLLRGGSPAARGRDYVFPPPCRRRSTLFVKVAWVWVGLVRYVPHGALWSGLMLRIRGAGRRGFLRRFCSKFFTLGENLGARKGGVDELGKLRSGAKRNGVILIIF
jgi:hypothetical protein